MEFYKAQVELSHGTTRTCCLLKWTQDENIEEGKYITFEDYRYNFMNGPKRLWKVDKLYQIERVHCHERGTYSDWVATYD